MTILIIINIQNQINSLVHFSPINSEILIIQFFPWGLLSEIRAFPYSWRLTEDFTDPRKQVKFPRMNCEIAGDIGHYLGRQVHSERISRNSLLWELTKIDYWRLQENLHVLGCISFLQLPSLLFWIFLIIYLVTFYWTRYCFVHLPAEIHFRFKKIMKSISCRLLRNYELPQKGGYNITLLLQKNYWWAWDNLFRLPIEK